MKDKKLLVSFTGAQSTGKTTLLNILEKHNSDINFIPEVTRKIKRELSLDINESGGWQTQQFITTQHLKNAYKHNLYAGAHTILDRCALDGYVYTLWLYRYQGLPSFCVEYARAAPEELKSQYDVIFYTCPDGIKLEDDGERSANSVFRDQIIDIFEREIRGCDNVVTLLGSVEERLQQIKTTLAKLNWDIKVAK